MRAGNPAIRGSRRLSLRRRYGNLARVAGCFATSLAATFFVGLEIQSNVIWVANGLLLSYLLLAPRWRWPGYLLAGFAGQICGNMLVGQNGPHTNAAVLAVLNVGEALLAAVFLRGRLTQLPRLTERYYLLRFLGLGVLAAPAVAAVPFAVIAHLWQHDELWPAFRDWATTDALGMTVATPAFVAIFRTRFIKETIGSWTNLLYPAALVILYPLMLNQTLVLPMAVVFPLLILTQLRLGLGWASMALLFVAGIGNLHLFRSGAPSGPAGPLDLLGPGIQFQLFLASAMFTLYTISVVMEILGSTERKLRETVYLHELVTKNSRDVIIIADFLGNRSYVSAAGSSLGGWTRDDLLSMHSLDLVHPDDRPRAAHLLRQLGTSGEATLECRVRKTDGSYLWVEASLRSIRDPVRGTPTGVLNIVRDISERKQAEESRAFHQSLLGAIHEGSLDGILVVDDQGKAVSYNRRFAEVWQIRAPDVPHSLLKPTFEVLDERLLAQCIDKTSNPAAFLVRVQELYGDRDADDQCEVELKDGRTLERYTTTLHTDDGRYLGRVWFFRDVTERIQAEQKLKAAYEEVERLAVVDALTGIANRRRFEEYLDAEWRRAIREQKPLSMVLLDVDLFKLFNDNYGHVRGDECLKQIAETMIEVVTRAGDVAARFGGEEFAIVLPNTDEKGALEIARQLGSAVSKRRISHEASPYGVVTISAGCATITPRLGVGPSQLVDWADQAMYEAKRRGRNRVYTSRNQDPEVGRSPSTPIIGDETQVG